MISVASVTASCVQRDEEEHHVHAVDADGERSLDFVDAFDL